MTETNNPYTIPLAILGAGLLIAGAIYYGGSNGRDKITNDSFASFKDALIAFVQDQDIEADTFEACLQEGRGKEKVAKEIADAQAAGASGTPYTIIVAKSGERFAVSGALPYEQIKTKIDAALAGEEGEPEDSSVYSMAAVTGEDHIRGSIDAEVVLVEFSDLDCPFCKQLHPTLKRLVDEYDGRVAWVYRHYPLEQLHPNAPLLAEASECVAQIKGNDAFWEFIDRYFALSQ